MSSWQYARFAENKSKKEQARCLSKLMVQFIIIAQQSAIKTQTNFDTNHVKHAGLQKVKSGKFLALQAHKNLKAKSQVNKNRILNIYFTQ